MGGWNFYHRGFEKRGADAAELAGKSTFELAQYSSRERSTEAANVPAARVAREQRPAGALAHLAPGQSAFFYCFDQVRSVYTNRYGPTRSLSGVFRLGVRNNSQPSSFRIVTHSASVCRLLRVIRLDPQVCKEHRLAAGLSASVVRFDRDKDGVYLG